MLTKKIAIGEWGGNITELQWNEWSTHISNELWEYNKNYGQTNV